MKTNDKIFIKVGGQLVLAQILTCEKDWFGKKYKVSYVRKVYNNGTFLYTQNIVTTIREKDILGVPAEEKNNENK